MLSHQNHRGIEGTKEASGNFIRYFSKYSLYSFKGKPYIRLNHKEIPT